MAKGEFETRGDLAREQLRRRSVPYFGDVMDAIERRLERLTPEARTAFATSCAQRLFDHHASLPPGKQRPFTMGWRPALDALWQALGGDEGAGRRVRQALDEFHASPYDHSDGQDGPGDADDDAAAACIGAAESLIAEDPKAAVWAAWRAVEHGLAVAQGALNLDPNDFDWRADSDPPMPLAQESMHPAVQGELARLVADLDLIERNGLEQSTLEALRRRRG